MSASPRRLNAQAAVTEVSRPSPDGKTTLHFVVLALSPRTTVEVRGPPAAVGGGGTISRPDPARARRSISLVPPSRHGGATARKTSFSGARFARPCLARADGGSPWPADGGSEKAVLDNVKPIRGGIPVVFPNFGYDAWVVAARGCALAAAHHMRRAWRPWALGPNHGFARQMPWRYESGGASRLPGRPPPHPHDSTHLGQSPLPGVLPNGNVSATFELVDTADTRAMWLVRAADAGIDPL